MGAQLPRSFCAHVSPSGVNAVDYCLYPSRETQLQWLRYYLQAQKGMAVTPREVERLYVQVNKFALVSACDWEAEGKEEPGGGTQGLPPAPTSPQPREEEAQPRVRGEALETLVLCSRAPNQRGRLERDILGLRLIVKCPVHCFPLIPSSPGFLLTRERLPKRSQLPTISH